MSKTASKSTLIWRIVFGFVFSILFAAFLVMAATSMSSSYKSQLKPIGQCHTAQMSIEASTKFVARYALIQMGVDFSDVAGIDEVAHKADPTDGLLPPYTNVKVCLTPDNKEIASVNDVNASG